MALRCLLIALAATVAPATRGARQRPADLDALEPGAPGALGGEDAAAEATRPAEPPAPIVWVPGFTSGPLEAYYNSSRGPLPNRWCHGVVPKDTWYPLYVSTSQALSPICYVWQMQLRPPETPGGCVRDAEGLEIREIGFGQTYAASAVNPSDYIQFKLYDNMIRELEKTGLVRDRSIRFAMYDWRKFGDRCWEREWYPRMKKLVEETAADEGRSVTLGCHSMGCLVVVAFLDSDFVDDAWKRKYVKEFLAVGPTFSGASMIMLNFMQGPTYQSLPIMLSQIGRDSVASMPALYTLMPVKGLGGWDENLTIIETPWKNYTIDSIYDGTFYSDVEGPEGLHHAPPPAIRSAREALAGQPAQAAAGTVGSADAESVAGSDGSTAEEPEGDVRLTEQGCICSSSCGYPGQDWQESFDIGAYIEGLPRPLRKVFLRPYCSTLGACGNWDFVHGHWDYCDVPAEPVDAGPGFEFYPLVDEPSRNYRRAPGAQVEELKAMCLENATCTGFTLDGWLKEGDMTPGKTWQGIAQPEGDLIPGLFVKRSDVRRCQAGLVPALDQKHAGKVCGNDGHTYYSEHLLLMAQCWRRPVPTKVHDGACLTTRTMLGCECLGECGLARNTLYEGTSFGWCFTQGECGYAMPRVEEGPFRGEPLRWDYCSRAAGTRGLDTGRGFEYFPGRLLWSELAEAAPGGFRRAQPPYSFEALQASCGEDAVCTGFTTEGWLLLAPRSPDGFDMPYTGLYPAVSDASAQGVYRKGEGVLSCQRLCTGPWEERRTVCVVEMRRTFESRCAAESALCYLDAVHGDSGARSARAGDSSRHRYIDGPCKRQMRTNLHSFAMDWVRRARDFKPPGVPTTCFYITSVPTESTWRVTDFLGKGVVSSVLPGDGTVTAQSIQGPCELWQRQQDAPVRLLPMAFSKHVSHVSMIMSRESIVEVLKLVREPWEEAEQWWENALRASSSDDKTAKRCRVLAPFQEAISTALQGAALRFWSALGGAAEHDLARRLPSGAAAAAVALATLAAAAPEV